MHHGFIVAEELGNRTGVAQAAKYYTWSMGSVIRRPDRRQAGLPAKVSQMAT